MKVFIKAILIIFIIYHGGYFYGLAEAASATSIRKDNAQGGLNRKGIIASIRVEGVQRIEASTVLSYLGVQPGDSFSFESIDASLKALFSTGLFADVSLKREGDTLVVVVVENSIINRIVFEGNGLIDENNLQKEILLRPRVVYTRTRVMSDVLRIQDLYRRLGRYAATVEPKIIKLDQNRVDLVFAINEGERTGVRRVSFSGNEQFSANTLQGKIKTKASNWWSLSPDDSYDIDRLQNDRDLLRRFYLTQGYADFFIISSTAELTPDRSDFFVTFTISEGKRYKFGKIDISSSLKQLDTATLKGNLITRSGDWYNAQEVENTIAMLTSAVNDFQYSFVDIRPRISRNMATQTIDIVYEINEGPRVYVERIDIKGNVRTQDRVIRREMLLFEGDPFNVFRLNRSKEMLENLDVFRNIAITTQEGSEPDRTVVVVSVEEKITSFFSINTVWISDEGPKIGIEFGEKNLLGRGIFFKLGFEISKKKQSFDFFVKESQIYDWDLAVDIRAILIIVTILTVVQGIGRYLAARWYRIRVEAFSLGVGPQIFGRTDKYGTLWRVCWIPIGSSVKFFNAESAQNGIDRITERDIAASFHYRRVAQRVAVIAAGSAANIVFGVITAVILFVYFDNPFLPSERKSFDWVRALKADDIRNGDIIGGIFESNMEYIGIIKNVHGFNILLPIVGIPGHSGLRLPGPFAHEEGRPPLIINFRKTETNMGDKNMKGVIWLAKDQKYLRFLYLIWTSSALSIIYSLSFFIPVPFFVGWELILVIINKEINAKNLKLMVNFISTIIRVIIVYIFIDYVSHIPSIISDHNLSDVLIWTFI